MEKMHDGRPCPDYIQQILGSPGALRARAEIRKEIALQDRQWGDTLAEWRNLHAAADLKARAETSGG